MTWLMRTAPFEPRTRALSFEIVSSRALNFSHSTATTSPGLAESSGLWASIVVPEAAAVEAAKKIKAAMPVNFMKNLHLENKKNTKFERG